MIGYQLTAFIGSTTVQGVVEWLRTGLPDELEERMKAGFDVTQPIAEAESEIQAQGFLSEELAGLAPYRFPAIMLRQTDDVETARTLLLERARKEFLECEARDLEGVERKLQTWIAQAKLPAGLKYKVHLWDERLSLELLHAGFSVEQQRRWDKGEDWPLWNALIAEAPEMATSRTTPNIQTGHPFRYLRRAGLKRGLFYLDSPAKKEWLRELQTSTPASELVKSAAAPNELVFPWRIVGAGPVSRKRGDKIPL